MMLLPNTFNIPGPVGPRRTTLQQLRNTTGCFTMNWTRADRCFIYLEVIATLLYVTDTTEIIFISISVGVDQKMVISCFRAENPSPHMNLVSWAMPSLVSLPMLYPAIKPIPWAWWLFTMLPT